MSLFFAFWEWTWGGMRILYLRGCCIWYTSLSQTCIRQRCSCPPCQILHTASQGSDVLIRFYRVPMKMDRNSVCPRQVWNFCGLDKSTILPVYFQLSTALYRPAWAAVHNTFFLSVFSLLLRIFFRSSRSVTTTVTITPCRNAHQTSEATASPHAAG